MVKLRGSRFLNLAVFSAALLCLTALPTVVRAAGIDECLECHSDQDKETFLKSAHAELQCTSCHNEIIDLAAHEDGKIDIQPVKCAKCHRDISGAVATSVHGANDVGCSDCHQKIHELPKKAGLMPYTEACSACHDTPFAGSVHGTAMAKGETDVPACHTCHGYHDVKPLGEKTSAERRRLTVESCRPCHAKEDLTTRHGLSTEYVKCYEESYHGKVYSLGYCNEVAGCADCHTPHDIRSADDPQSTVNQANLAKTCGVEQCHPGANVKFALYAPHASHRDKEKYPIFFWTFWTMSALLIGVFGFFWLHTLLWWQRAFRENREKRAAGHHAVPAELALKGEVYRRFDTFSMVMHLLMVVSFLGLVFTGLPLKFTHAFWAVPLIKFWGGAQGAGLWHRICAVITFFYFIAVVLRSMYFLFIQKTGQGFWGKLFGPDSLFPNLQDGRDIAGMFKWFFGMGPKPAFGRWTYWEKFDFLAVFWGMFAIGFTGLMLWFPTFFAKFLPGWMFNVSTIMHSDEALLAAGFIFTVHFFNTHLRPEKFPMDLVIFTGSMPSHELIDERPLQIKLEKSRGDIEAMQTTYRSSAWEFISQIIGYAAVVLGLVGVYLMVSGFFA